MRFKPCHPFSRTSFGASLPLWRQVEDELWTRNEQRAAAAAAEAAAEAEAEELAKAEFVSLRAVKAVEAKLRAARSAASVAAKTPRGVVRRGCEDRRSGK